MSSESDNTSVEFSGDLPSLTRPMIAVAIGNTRTRVGIMAGTECLKAQSLRSGEANAIAEEIR
ncbi:MAG: hypothetical protein ACF8LL_14995 [Phycisphaerales bacterium]